MLRHPVQWLRERPHVWDAVLAFVLGTIGVIGLLTIDVGPSDSAREGDALGIALAVGIWAMVAVRRRFTEVALWVTVALTVAYWVLQYVDGVTSVGVLILVYTVAAHVDRPRSLRIGIAVGIILIGTMASGMVFDAEDLPPIAVLANAIIFATAWTIGDSVRHRQAYLAEVEDRAERAEQERETAATHAVQDERVRIARELHDVVAHSVSVMVVQAAAGRRVLAHDPQQATEALTVIESTGRNALDELRRLLGVLRQDDGSPAAGPQPTADDVHVLIEQWRDAGLDVHLEVVGDRDDLPAGVGLTVYRIVQEALTNVMKHAGPARAHVQVRYEDTVHIEVVDDGRGVQRDVPSSGQGLIGMRERVEMFGGTLAVGPRPGGGYRVRATIPSTRASVA